MKPRYIFRILGLPGAGKTFLTEQYIIPIPHIYCEQENLYHWNQLLYDSYKGVPGAAFTCQKAVIASIFKRDMEIYANIDSPKHRINVLESNLLAVKYFCKALWKTNRLSEYEYKECIKDCEQKQCILDNFCVEKSLNIVEILLYLEVSPYIAYTNIHDKRKRPTEKYLDMAFLTNLLDIYKENTDKAEFLIITPNTNIFKFIEYAMSM